MNREILNTLQDIDECMISAGFNGCFCTNWSNHMKDFVCTSDGSLASETLKKSEFWSVSEMFFNGIFLQNAKI